MKSFYKIFFVFVIFLIFFSCTLTRKLWHPTYNETIRHFLVSQDGQYVAFLSKNYHYIFNDDRNNSLKKILFSKYRYLLYLDLKSTKILLKQNNDIAAEIVVKVNTLNPPDDAIRHCIELGFVSDKNQLFKKIKIFGKRYQAINGNFDGILSLNRFYDVKIEEEINDSDRVEKILLTPITITADSVLLIGKVVLAPLGFRFNKESK